MAAAGPEPTACILPSNDPDNIGERFRVVPQADARRYEDGV